MQASPPRPANRFMRLRPPTATDDATCLTMLLRCGGETPNQFIKRLNKAIHLAWSEECCIDEVNDGRSDRL